MSVDDRTGAYDGTSTSGLAELLAIWSRKTALAVRTHVPATVTVYDPATQTVTVTVDHLEVERVVNIPGADAQNLTKPRPPLVVPGVPVIWPGSGDGLAYLTFPIVPTSTGLLAVMDRDLATWLNRGAPLPVDPVMSKLHPLSSVVFLPGLTDSANRIATPTDLTAAVLEHPTGIKLGRTATLGVARLNDTSSPTPTETAWRSLAQPILAAAGAFFGLPAPVLPVGSIVQIDAASTKVKAQ